MTCPVTRKCWVVDQRFYCSAVTDAQEVRADAAEVLRSAFAGDGAGVVGAFDALVDRGGVGAVYDVAWCLAATMVGERLVTGPWRLEFPDIEDATYDTRWVARFLSAYANADQMTAEALFRVAQVDGKLEQCLLTLAGSAVATMRRRTA
ncbi:hypothetical protein Val02_69430 [Virgisporangium aliadipatigenens]|uniref:Uncharacterized protein n=1 Tax=Virgisporangium aliadipatigenens TaxID=741659 RepID=A0A8J3YSZ8_9ACTN|nr:hypothetical protein Val02_69430 [Virgisporangium aliadipatigenens]